MVDVTLWCGLFSVPFTGYMSWKKNTTMIFPVLQINYCVHIIHKGSVGYYSSTACVKNFTIYL